MNQCRMFCCRGPFAGGKHGKEIIMQKDIKTELSSIDEYVQFYGNNFYCSNCRTRNHRYIKKGVRLDTVAFECDKCGCTVRV